MEEIVFEDGSRIEFVENGDDRFVGCEESLYWEPDTDTDSEDA